MKKFVVFSLILFSFVLAGCGKLIKQVGSAISEDRFNIFTGETDQLSATLMCGKREQEYVVNGYSTPLINFGVITITLKKPSISHNNARVVITIDTNRYEEVLEENPFDGTLVCDIKTITELNDVTIKVFLDNLTQEITLHNISNSWKINHSDALKLACKVLSHDLKTQISSDVYKGEVYVKIIKDTKVNKGEYYWYVSFIGRNGNNHTVIINPLNGEVLAKN